MSLCDSPVAEAPSSSFNFMAACKIFIKSQQTAKSAGKQNSVHVLVYLSPSEVHLGDFAKDAWTQKPEVLVSELVDDLLKHLVKQVLHKWRISGSGRLLIVQALKFVYNVSLDSAAQNEFSVVTLSSIAGVNLSSEQQSALQKLVQRLKIVLHYHKTNTGLVCLTTKYRLDEAMESVFGTKDGKLLFLLPQSMRSLSRFSQNSMALAQCCSRSEDMRQKITEGEIVEQILEWIQQLLIGSVTCKQQFHNRRASLAQPQTQFLSKKMLSMRKMNNCRRLSKKISAEEFMHQNLDEEINLVEKLKSRVLQFIADIKNNRDPAAIIESLERRLYGQRLFLNMVVHDLRNPSESIHHGNEFVLKLQKSEITKIVEAAVSKIKQCVNALGLDEQTPKSSGKAFANTSLLCVALPSPMVSRQSQKNTLKFSKDVLALPPKIIICDEEASCFEEEKLDFDDNGIQDFGSISSQSSSHTNVLHSMTSL